MNCDKPFRLIERIFPFHYLCVNFNFWLFFQLRENIFKLQHRIGLFLMRRIRFGLHFGRKAEKWDMIWVESSFNHHVCSFQREGEISRKHSWDYVQKKSCILLLIQRAHMCICLGECLMNSVSKLASFVWTVWAHKFNLQRINLLPN